MSHLREIMQKLAQAHRELQSGKMDDSSAASELLKANLDEYLSKIKACNTGMLQYEWAWLNEHIDALQLCVCQPEMWREIGGHGHAERLLAESKQQRSALEELFKKRGIHPAAHHHEIHPGEHAWDVRSEISKRNWGMV